MSENSISPDTKLGYVHLTVTNLDRSIDFYQRALGLKLHRREGNAVYLGAGKDDLLALTENSAAQHPRRATGLYHFAILVPSRLELAHALKRIAVAEVPITGFADHLVSEAIYLPDPDNNGIEIYRDRPRREWTYVNGDLQMATDPLDIQGLLAELNGQDELNRSLDPETVLGHMHLHVANIREAEEFYIGILGFDMTTRYGPTATFVSAGGYHHHIAFNTWAGVGAPPPPKDAVGLRYFLVHVPNRAELERVLQRVRAAGLPVTETDAGSLVRDPSQNTVVLANVEEKNRTQSAAKHKIPA